MSPDQCRAAREHLNWSQEELASASGVPLAFLVGFENGAEINHKQERLAAALRGVLEDVGFGFPIEISNGRATPAGIIFSKRDRSEVN